MDDRGGTLRLVKNDFSLPSYPGRSVPVPRIFIVFPDLHKSGGPAHFHQVHSDLNRVGLNSQMYFVNPYYQDSYMQNISSIFLNQSDPRRFNPSALDSRDILVLPCYWEDYISKDEEASIRGKGVRSIVLVTGVSYPQDETYLSLADYTQSYAIPFAHSHYSHNYYRLPWDASKHVLWAPVEQWVIDAHAQYEKEKLGGRAPNKENRILVDPDAKVDIIVPAEHTLSPPTPVQVTPLFGYNRSALIELFKRSKLMYDIYLNGHEHLPREAVLFDCVPILSKADNGVDPVDFPLPSYLLLDELDEAESTQTVGNALLNYRSIKERIEPLKKAVLQRPEQLRSNLKATFASRSYQFQIKTSTFQEEGYALVSALQIFTHLPLASVEIVVRPGGKFRLLRRGGGLTARLILLGLMDKGGGSAGHSLRIVESGKAELGTLHGELIVRMPRPYFIHDMQAFLQEGNALLQKGEDAYDHDAYHYGCAQNLVYQTAPGPEISELGDVVVNLLYGDEDLMHKANAACKQAATNRAEARPVQKRTIPGFVNMPFLFSSRLNDVTVTIEKSVISQTCESLCKLSRSPAWASVGIFRRVFDYSKRRKSTSIELHFGSSEGQGVGQSISCDADAESVVETLCVTQVIPFFQQKGEEFELESCKRSISVVVEGKLNSPECLSDDYNGVCSSFCTF